MMHEARYSDPNWVAAQIVDDNRARSAEVFSARFEFSNGRAFESLPLFRADGALRADVQGSSQQVVIEFDPTLTKKMAERAVALGGILLVR